MVIGLHPLPKLPHAESSLHLSRTQSLDSRSDWFHDAQNEEEQEIPLGKNKKDQYFGPQRNLKVD